MALEQTKSDQFGVWDRPPRRFKRSYSVVSPSQRAGERRRLMLDGSDLSLSDRLGYALGLLTPEERKERIEKSAQQLRRYLDGADPPFSVLVMISAASGVPVAWLAEGRADIPSISAEGVDTPIPFGVPVGGRLGSVPEQAQDLGRVQRAPAGEEAAEKDFGVRTPGFGVMEPPGKSIGLAWQANPDLLAKAYEMALNGIVATPGRRPDPKRLMQVTLLIYDELLEATTAPAEVSQRPDNDR